MISVSSQFSKVGIEAFATIIKSQGYADYYRFQSIPVIGAFVSLPVAAISCAGAIHKLFQAVSSACQRQGKEASKSFWEARDLTVICLNNFLNVLSFGLLNFMLMRNGLSAFLKEEKPITGPTSCTFSFQGQRVTCTKVALAAGDHPIQLLHGTKSKEIITTQHPIYETRLPIDGSVRPCLVMRYNDFHLIKNKIHGGAFGGDYRTIGDDWVVVWKIPADLLYISGFSMESSAPAEVGTYALFDDNAGGHEPATLMNQGVTKLRYDFKQEDSAGNVSVTSVHCLQARNKHSLPAISTGTFYQNFNGPREEEMAKVLQLIQNLKNLGIDAFSCNGAHHAIVFYAQIKEEGPQLLTAQAFAHLLKEKPAILEAIKAAALPGKNLDDWQAAYLSVFGESEKK